MHCMQRSNSAAVHYGIINAELVQKTIYRTRAIIIRGLNTFYPLFEVHLCTVTFGLIYA